MEQLPYYTRVPGEARGGVALYMIKLVKNSGKGDSILFDKLPNQVLWLFLILKE